MTVPDNFKNNLIKFQQFKHIYFLSDSTKLNLQGSSFELFFWTEFGKTY